MAALAGDKNVDNNLPEKARLALLTASAQMRFSQKEVDVSLDEEEEQAKIQRKKEKLLASLPYTVPEPKLHADDVLEENLKLLSHEPMSSMKWYKKVR